MRINQLSGHLATLAALFAVSLVFNTTSEAALEVVEKTYELTTEKILRWPLRAGDSFVIKPCSGCDVATLQVTDETRYATGFGTPAIPLRELLKKKSQLRNSAEGLVIIFFQPSNLQVTRMILQTKSK